MRWFFNNLIKIIPTLIKDDTIYINLYWKERLQGRCEGNMFVPRSQRTGFRKKGVEKFHSLEDLTIFKHHLMDYNESTTISNSQLWRWAHTCLTCQPGWNSEKTFKLILARSFIGEATSRFPYFNTLKVVWSKYDSHYICSMRYGNHTYYAHIFFFQATGVKSEIKWTCSFAITLSSVIFIFRAPKHFFLFLSCFYHLQSIKTTFVSALSFILSLLLDNARAL